MAKARGETRSQFPPRSAFRGPLPAGTRPGLATAQRLAVVRPFRRLRPRPGGPGRRRPGPGTGHTPPGTVPPGFTFIIIPAREKKPPAAHGRAVRPLTPAGCWPTSMQDRSSGMAGQAPASASGGGHSPGNAADPRPLRGARGWAVTRQVRQDPAPSRFAPHSARRARRLPCGFRARARSGTAPASPAHRQAGRRLGSRHGQPRFLPGSSPPLRAVLQGTDAVPRGAA